MQIKSKRTKASGLVIVAALAGCGFAHDESVACSQLGDNFFSNRQTVMRKFDELPLERKYLAYICGNQTVRPPMTSLSTKFANEGRVGAVFLMEQLGKTSYDLTVVQVMEIFFGDAAE